MKSSAEHRLRGLTSSEMRILRTVKEAGALLEPELPVKLDRDNEDLTPEVENLRKRSLVEIRTVRHFGETIRIYLSARDIPALS